MKHMQQMLRFCYLGSLEPTYTLNRGNIDVNGHLKEARRFCYSVSASEFKTLMQQLMTSPDLPRHDETLFVYAVYLIADLHEDSWRNEACKALPEVISDESDLFLFIKYATMVQKARGRTSWISRTVRKTIVTWYQAQPTPMLHRMLTTRLRRHGFSHKIILQLCHIPDSKFSSTALPLIRQFFVKPKKCVIGNGSDTTDPIADSEFLTARNICLCENLDDALVNISSNNLTEKDVPQHLWDNEQIYAGLIENMSIPQILSSWRFIVRQHLLSFRVIDEVRKALNNENKLRQCNLHPISYLYCDHRKQPENVDNPDTSKQTLNILREIYPRTFGLNKPLGVRMHISISVDSSYLRKRVYGADRNMRFEDAVVGLAFGYFKVEEDVTVAHWNLKGELCNIAWEKAMSIEDAAKVIKRKYVPISKRVLTAPILHAMEEETKYDVFLAIVPIQHPNCSDYHIGKLNSALAEYQTKLNCNARFILVNASFNRMTSLNLTKDTNNILQICGIHDNTAKLISAFAQSKFM